MQTVELCKNMNLIENFTNNLQGNIVILYRYYIILLYFYYTNPLTLTFLLIPTRVSFQTEIITIVCYREY